MLASRPAPGVKYSTGNGTGGASGFMKRRFGFSAEIRRRAETRSVLSPGHGCPQQQIVSVARGSSRDGGLLSAEEIRVGISCKRRPQGHRLLQLHRTDGARRARAGHCIIAWKLYAISNHWPRGPLRTLIGRTIGQPLFARPYMHSLMRVDRPRVFFLLARARKKSAISSFKATPANWQDVSKCLKRARFYSRALA